MKLSENLRKYRQHNQLTQIELARKLHVSRKTISNWENGRSQPSYQTLDALSHIYGVSTNTFFDKTLIKTHKIIIISYYISTILLILYYLFIIKHLHIAIYVQNFMVINIIFLTLNYKKWQNVIKNKFVLFAILFIIILDIFFNTWFCMSPIKITLSQILHYDSAYETAALGGVTLRILILTYTSSITLFLSKNLKFLVTVPLNKLKNK